MGRRWLDTEYGQLDDMRRRLADVIKTATPFPEVVGDRRLMRFLRGNNHNVEKAAKVYRDFLYWRRDNAIDDVRNDIVYGGKNEPRLFPKGELILQLVPQIAVTPFSTDKIGQPMVYEADGYSPSAVLESISLEDYTLFLIYVLEYRAIITEQMSENVDRRYESEHPDPATRANGYGALVKLCMIRDLKGLGLEHLGSQFKSIVMKFLTIAVPNYPEQVGKFHVINAPWVFNAIWSFARRILDSGTLSKFELYGTQFMDGLQTDIPIASIPRELGGELIEGNGPFTFDISETGPLHYPGAPTPETYVSKGIALSSSLVAPLEDGDGFISEGDPILLQIEDNAGADSAEVSKFIEEAQLGNEKETKNSLLSESNLVVLKEPHH